MTDEYRRAVDLFHKIIDLPATEQSAALDRECAGETALRQEVADLLAAYQQADHDAFLKRPALLDAASQIHPPNAGTNPPAGTVLGKYRLMTQIGAGGMGTVFEAEDLHLSRRVAVKILSKGGQ